LGCVLCPGTWSVLVNVPHELERNVHSAVVGQSCLHISDIQLIDGG